MAFRKRDYSGSLSPEVTEMEKAHRAIARRAAAEGMVLLQNDGVLPLQKGQNVALYSGGARYTIKGGTGSGSVNNRSNVSVDEGLRNAGLRITTDAWLDHFDAAYAAAREEWMQKIYGQTKPGEFFSLYTAYSANRLQMPAGEPFTRTEADVAIYVISRISGESIDRRTEKGDYFLTDVEEADLTALSRLYPKLIVILNVGGVIDLSFLDRIPVSALVLMSQAGMEGGNALADVLTGNVPFSGKLTDSWAYRYEDYPAADTFGYRNGNLIQEKYTEGIFVGYRYFDSFGVKPRFPFGFGLSYTDFRIEPVCTEVKESEICVSVQVTNTGIVPGKEVVQLYAACPGVRRASEYQRLVAFQKTKLLKPGESQHISLSFAPYALASYHTARSEYYLDAGGYGLFVGNASDHTALASVLTVSKLTVLQKLSPICELLDALTEIAPDEAMRQQRAQVLQSQYDGSNVPKLSIDGILKTLPCPQVSENPALKAQADAILAQMTPMQKARLVCGQPSFGSSEVVGVAAVHVPGAAGETTASVENLGIGEMVLADGPAGLRLQQCYEVNSEDGQVYRLNGFEGLENRFFGKQFLHEGALRYYQFCSAIPVGTLLAQTFDPELLYEVGQLIGREMKLFGVTLWLAPGMNIHRNPLCGRNFEYYSEDPLVSGLCAAAITRGVQSFPGIGTTIKHFACNNQEDNRMGVSSVVSERALREIYLKGFEIAVKTAQPRAIMTSYNRLNSVHTANSFDLCTTVARGEWGFGGIIMTDWVTTNAGHGSSAVKCILAGNDLIMPGNASDIREILDALEAKKDLYLPQDALDTCVRRMLMSILSSDVTM